MFKDPPKRENTCTKLGGKVDVTKDDVNEQVNLLDLLLASCGD